MIPEEQNSPYSTETASDGSEQNDSADRQAPEANSADNPSQQNTSKRHPKKKNSLIVRLLTALLLIAVALSGGLAFYASTPVYNELGGEPSLGRYESGLFRTLCQPLDNASAIDTGSLSETFIPAKLFGFIPWKIRVVVRDTTPPKLETRSLIVMSGMDISPSEFVASAEDLTPVTISFAEEPDLISTGERQLTIVASDSSGNVTKSQTLCTVTDSTVGIWYELGTPSSDILSDLSSRFGEDISIPDLDEGVCGSYTASVSADDRISVFTVTLKDTLPPEAVTRDAELLVGEDIIPADVFLSSVSDASEISVTTEMVIDTLSPGEGSTKLIIADSWGNSSDFEVKYHIHSAPRKITIEAGTKADELTGLLFTEKDGLNIPSPSNPESISRLSVGSFPIVYECEHGEIEFIVTVEDTIPPEITLKSIETTKGTLPSPEKFVKTSSDATKLTFRYETEPDVSATGTFTVAIIAADEGGNETRAEAELTVIYDTTPPVISGVKNIYSYEGDTIAYRSGVSAIDETDGKVKFYVDSSKVNPNKAGSYKITYTASDSNGNTASATATVIVRKVTQEVINSKADEILDELLTSNMSQREKAKVIYDWCRENLKYSTATSYLMGDYLRSAYSGYRLHYGNCYTYYAVARSLLTRAGFTNMMIQRNSVSNPHYWNLVKVDGNWYHFDTCPQPSQNNDGCFLLTDAEVAAYSRNKESGYYSFNKKYYPPTP